MNKQRALVALALLTLASARPQEARADATGTQAPGADPASPRVSFKESPDLRALPEATPIELRTPEVPKRIEAGEQALGLWTGKPTWDLPAEKAAVAPKKRGRKASKKAPRAPASAALPSITLVAPAPLAATALDRASPRLIGLESDRDGREIGSHDTCFSPAEGKVPTKDALVSFGPVGENVIVMSDESGPGVSPSSQSVIHHRGSSPLRLIRAEHLSLDAAGKAALEITYAWVDTRSGGARLIQAQRIPLQQIQEAPGGARVFGYRTGNKASFVVQLPPALPERVSDPSLQITRGQGSIESTVCHHVTVSLDVGKAGESETVTLAGELALKVTTPAVDDGEVGSEIKLRPFRLSLSETWLSSDPAPVLSSSFAWTGKLHGEGGRSDP